MINLIRWLRGYVVFELFGKFPERFMNVCTRQGRSLFNASPKGKGFYGSMLLCDYKTIRPVARKCGVRLRVKRRCGLPFLLKRYGDRKGLLAGAAAFIAIIILMQSFVFTVEINGLTSLSEVSFRALLKENGLYQGAFKVNLDLHSIERRIMQDAQDIGWMSINIIGTKAEIEIKEKDKKPVGENRDVPCNIKASTDGVVVEINTKRGKAVILPGSAVKEGQLLVSGVLENALGDVSFVHSDAEVIAETTRNVTYKAEKQGMCKLPVKTVNRQNVDFIWLSVPINFSPVNEEYTSRVVTQRLNLNNTAVACGISTEICTVYEESEFLHTEKSAQDALCAQDALFRLFCLKDCETIKVIQTKGENKDDYTLDVQYICREDISVKENFVVN